MIEITNECFDEYEDLQFVTLGKFNQDALENLFFQIQSASGLNLHHSLRGLHRLFTPNKNS